MDKKKLMVIDGSSVAFRAFLRSISSWIRFKNANGLHTMQFGTTYVESCLKRVEPSHVLSSLW